MKTVGVKLNDDEFQNLIEIKEAYAEDTYSDAIRMMIADEANLLIFKRLQERDPETFLNNVTPGTFDVLLDKPLSVFATGMNWTDKDNLKQILAVYTDANDKYNAILRSLVKAKVTLLEDKSSKSDVINELSKELTSLEKGIKDVNSKMDVLINEKVN